MKTALVCIAKEEDNYIDEWIKYHLKLGFNDIFVYQNDWRYAGNKDQYTNVCWIPFDGKARQLEAYHDFIKNHSNEYDWTAFFDVDEFLCIKNYLNIKNFLQNYEDYYAIGINWRYFGNSAHMCINHGNYSLLSRFKMAEYKLDSHIKTILHTSKTSNMKIEFCNPHFIQQALSYDFTINTKKSQFIHGMFNEDFDQAVQLNHYYCKTLDEYLLTKRERGTCDLKSVDITNIYDISKFSAANKNDIEDLYAYNFYNDRI